MSELRSSPSFPFHLWASKPAPIPWTNIPDVEIARNETLARSATDGPDIRRGRDRERASRGSFNSAATSIWSGRVVRREEELIFQ